MTSILKNTTINDTGFLGLPAGPSSQRLSDSRTVVSFTTVGSGTWTVPTGVTTVQVLVVAGGGGGCSSSYGGGGGAGGLIFNSNYSVTPGGSVSYTVGGGGAIATNGSNSVFGTLTAIGGGAGLNTAGNSGCLLYTSPSPRD